MQHCSAQKPATPRKNPKLGAMKFPAKRGKGPQCDGNSGGEALGPFLLRVQQAKTTASVTKNK